MTFPPRVRTDPREWRRDGRSTIPLNCRWGQVRLPAQIWESRVTPGEHQTLPDDPTADHSGYSPQALDDLVTLARLLSYEEAVEFAPRLGLHLSSSSLQRLVAPVAEHTRVLVRDHLEQLADQPLEHVPEAKKRVMVVQADGVIVLGRKTGANVTAPDLPRETGEAIEVKTLTVFRQEAPQERFTAAEACCADDFMPLLAGALRVGGVRQQDDLIGVSDGAVWIEERFRTLGVTQHVLDVFHAVEYVDRLMGEMGWTEKQRAEERQAWLRGECDGGRWLETYVSASAKRKLSPEGFGAWRYLHSRVHLMAYPTYRARGWPIGSGQIEGVNKSVIGGRMKGSGMHWSRSGATGMAALRAYGDHRHHVIPFDDIRHHAFPIPA